MDSTQIDKYDYSRNWNNVEKDLANCDLSIVIHTFLHDIRFTEEFILNNRIIFNDLIDYIVKYKKTLSDNFFIKLCTKWNYLRYKYLHKQNNLMKDFSELDKLFNNF